MNIWKINIFEWLNNCDDHWFVAKICLIIKLFRTVCLHAFCHSSPYKQDLNQTPSISVKSSKISSPCSLHSELLKFWYSLISLGHLECRQKFAAVSFEVTCSKLVHVLSSLTTDYQACVRFSSLWQTRATMGNGHRLQQEEFWLDIRKISQWGCSNMGTGCPEQLWKFVSFWI